MLKETIIPADVTQIKSDIDIVEQDLAIVDAMEWHGADVDERRWNLLDEVKNLQTWNLWLAVR